MYKGAKQENPREYGMRFGKFGEKAMLGAPEPFDAGLSNDEDYRPGGFTRLVRENLPKVMQACREAQTDDMTWPKKPFLRRLVSDVEEGIIDQMGELPGELEVRVCSAVGSILDLAGVDFWVELFDDDGQQVLADFKVDLKMKPGEQPGGAADYVYYCDDIIASSDDREAIFNTADYKDLVSRTVDQLLQARQTKSYRRRIERATGLGESRDFS